MEEVCSDKCTNCKYKQVAGLDKVCLSCIKEDLKSLKEMIFDMKELTSDYRQYRFTESTPT